jgi:hypothetical protein
VRFPKAPFGVAGWPQDQPVVGLDHVDGPLQTGLHQQLEPVLGQELVSVRALVGQFERDPVAGPVEPNDGVGVEAARRLVRPCRISIAHP